MPARLIKESCRTSKNLQQLADFSERLFWRLLTTADDFGRCYANPPIVRANCFPLADTISLKKIEAAMDDLEKHQLITRYSIGERVYVQFVTFEKHQGNPRAKVSKFPALTSLSAGTCLQLQADARNCKQMQTVPDMPASAPDTDTDTDTDLNPSSLNPSSLNPSSSDLKRKDCAEDFEIFWESYPKKIGKKDALKAWIKAEDKPELQDILQAIEQAKRSSQWTKEQGRFIPNPATWLNQGRWADQPIARPLSMMERFMERHKDEGISA